MLIDIYRLTGQMRPLITIVTVCYNSEKTIERTIRSVIGQSFEDVEYIIIDGGSNDGTLEIIQKYESYISFWQSEPDHGIYDAMNKGIKQASGRYIAFLNSDDWYVDGALENVAGFINKYPDSDVIYGDVFHEENGTRNVVKYDRADLDQLYVRLFIIHQAIFVKTELLKIRGFNTEYKVGADYDLIINLYKNGNIFRHLDSIIVCFSGGGYSSKNTKLLATEYRDISTVAISGNDVLIEKYQRAINTHYYSTMFMEYQFRADFNVFLCEWINDHVDKKNKYYIFGAGVVGKRCLALLRQMGIVNICFIDNDTTKQGSIIEGAEVFPINCLSNAGAAVVVISSLANEEGIRKQLNQYIIHDVVVFTYSEMLSKIVVCYEKSRRGNSVN